MTVPPKLLKTAPARQLPKPQVRKPKVRNYTKGPVAKLGLAAGKPKPKPKA